MKTVYFLAGVSLTILLAGCATIRGSGDVDQGRKHLTPITMAARRKADDIVDFLRDKGATLSIVTWL